MKFRIRPFEECDTRALSEIRRMKGVRETITSHSSESFALTEELLKNTPPSHPNLCAVIDMDNGAEKLIGNALLRLTEKAKMRHTGVLAVTVHTDYHNMGVGRALLTELLRIADDDLMLVRVGLEVAEENEQAIHLYESLGFVREGLLRYAYTEGGKLKISSLWAVTGFLALWPTISQFLR